MGTGQVQFGVFSFEHISGSQVKLQWVLLLKKNFVVFLQTLYLTWSDAGLILAHGVEREVVDVPVVLVPRLEEGDHAVEQQEEEEEEDESLLATHLERNGYHFF